LSKIIICVHGLGNKPKKELITKWWRQSIREGLIGINKYVFNPKIEMVYWADILYEKPLDEKIQDKNNPYYLQEYYTPAPKNFTHKSPPTRKKILSFIERQMDKLFINDDQSINYSFISDYVIHKYFKDLESYYNNESRGTINKDICSRDLIRKRLTDVLSKYKNDEIFLIAHSMGTIIAYDVLILELTDVKIHTFITMGSPLGIPTVIGKIANEYKEKFKKSEFLATPSLITHNWFNFSDLEDKVAINFDLQDDYRPNANGIKPIDFEVTNNYMINGEVNPHKSYGYLRTPEFSKVLFDFMICDKNKITVWMLNVYNNFYKWFLNTTFIIMKKIYFSLKGIEYES